MAICGTKAIATACALTWRGDTNNTHAGAVRMLAGQTILVVEDEALVGLDIADAIREAGAHVILSHNVRDALTKVAAADVAAAVLDINLAGEDCSPVCLQLAARGIPFLFHTAYTTPVPALVRWPNAPVVRKPSLRHEIPTALNTLMNALLK